MDETSVPRSAERFPRNPELLVTRTLIGDGYVIRLRGGHRLVDVPTGRAILGDCLAAIERHAGDRHAEKED